VFSFSPQKVERLNDAILTFAEKLRENMVDVDVHNLVFKVARLKGVDPPQLFKVLYESLIGKEYGPRFGKLVTTLGVAKVKDSLLRLYRG
jgi:lysyl-tRNA synthetase class I